MLLSFVVVKSTVLLNSTDIVEAEFMLKESLLQLYIGHQPLGHFSLIDPSPNLCYELDQWFVHSHVSQLLLIFLQGK